MFAAERDSVLASRLGVQARPGECSIIGRFIRRGGIVERTQQELGAVFAEEPSPLGSAWLFAHGPEDWMRTNRALALRASASFCVRLKIPLMERKNTW